MANWHEMAIKRAHVELLAYCWIEMLPKHCPGISVDDAVFTWSMFRKNPSDPRLAAAKRMANEMWLRLVQSN